MQDRFIPPVERGRKTKHEISVFIHHKFVVAAEIKHAAGMILIFSKVPIAEMGLLQQVANPSSVPP